MTKFRVTYELDAMSLEDAMAFAHVVLLESDDDCVTNVSVTAVNPTLWDDGFLVD